MNDLTFKDIKYVYMSTGAGGTFYVRNITGVTSSAFEYSPSEPSAYSPVVFNASNSGPKDQIVNYSWNFGDGNTTSTTEAVISHTYMNAGTLNVTLTVTDEANMNASTTQTILVKLPSYLSISTDSSSSIVGSVVNINGKLTTTVETGSRMNQSS
jgi:PKD repeat protein